MRQNVTVIDLNLNHRYVPKHKRQVQLDELEHFVTKEQAVIDLMKKQKTKPCNSNKKKTPSNFFCPLPVFPEMSKHYNQKASLEQELPTVTQKLSTTSECLLGSLGSLTSSTGKVRPTGGRC